MLRFRYWGAHLVMVLAVAVAIGLALWQYDAWGERRDEAARDLIHTKAVPLGDLITADSAFPAKSVGQPVTFTGTWVPDSTVYVSERRHAKKSGYWVVSAVQVAGGKSAVPVVRGWAAKPDAAGPGGPVEVEGWLQPTEGAGVPDDDRLDQVIPEMRIASIVEHVSTDLYSAFVVADHASSGTSGLAPVKPEAIPDASSFTALRNLFYALEWLVFGGFAVFLWWRWCRDTLEAAAGASVESAA